MTEIDVAQGADEVPGLLDLVIPLAERWKLLVVGPLSVGVLALGLTYLIKPTYTARTVFLPPQEQQSVAASALASLGAVAGLAGIGGVKSPADQYVSLMQSTTVDDRIIDRFDLMKVYGKEFRDDVRHALDGNVQISIGKKDGLITVEVDDTDPKRAADIANAEVDELRRMTKDLALTEAQQRRVFFEAQLKQTRGLLTRAQVDLQGSGFNPGALKAEPKAAAERYADLRALVSAAEVRLQTMRRSLTDSAPEIQQQVAELAALRAQLEQVEAATPASPAPGAGVDYIGKYREFKYEEALFDLLSRQYEMARLDESREGTLIQVVDPATPPERKSRPKRGLTAVAVTFGTFLLLSAFVLVRQGWRRAETDSATRNKAARLRAALRWR